MGYAFGDTAPAAERLQLVHKNFSESSRLFMRKAAGRRPKMAADLGCGPGYTTHLLADTLCPHRTIGLDNSANFVGLAKSTASDTVSFHLHDVTTGPFPSTPYDVIFGRFVLAHLRTPEMAVALWVEQLNTHGLLLMEEVEYIDVCNLVFKSYLEIQQAMLAKQGNSLYVGARLEQIVGSTPLTRRLSEVRTVAVPASSAAKMFHMNLGVWRHNDYVERTHEQAELDELESDLAAIASGSRHTRPLEWGIRQVAMERAWGG